MLHTIGRMCLLQLQARTRPLESHYLWLIMNVSLCEAARDKLHFCRQMSTSTARVNWVSCHVRSHYARHSVITTTHAVVLHQWRVFLPVNHTPRSHTASVRAEHSSMTGECQARAYCCTLCHTWHTCAHRVVDSSPRCRCCRRTHVAALNTHTQSLWYRFCLCRCHNSKMIVTRCFLKLLRIVLQVKTDRISVSVSVLAPKK